MKYALFNGEDVEATKGAKGQCRSCGSELIAKCGENRIHHWAHKGSRICDPWWENETDWHRSWKNHFPKTWQEVIHTDEASGEKHIADVKTESGWVLEFQHSLIKPEERRSRNAFYPKLVWVLDGTRRLRDKTAFYRILSEFSIRSIDSRFRAVMGQDDCRLIEEWHDSNALVFFDFQEMDAAGQPLLWFLFPKASQGEAYLWPFSKKAFVELHETGKFDELVQKAILPFFKRLLTEEQNKIAAAVFRQRQMASGMPLMAYRRAPYPRRRFRF